MHQPTTPPPLQGKQQLFSQAHLAKIPNLIYNHELLKTF